MLSEKNIENINSGKTRGYSVEKIINDINYFLEYAIKKSEGEYICYFFSIPCDQMDVIEDSESDEKIERFESLEEALKFIQKNGGEFDRFSAFKGVKPI